jgi:ATP-dependent DNA helicase RecQ
LEVSGVGEHKAEKYGKQFLKVIRKHRQSEFGGNTHEYTWKLYQEGKSVAEIAQSRGITMTTIYSHLAHLLSFKDELNIFDFLDKNELKEVARAAEHLGLQEGLKSYFEFLEGELDYGKIRLGLAYLQKQAKNQD